MNEVHNRTRSTFFVSNHSSPCKVSAPAWLFISDAPAKAKLYLYAANGTLALQAKVQVMDISALPVGLYMARVVAPNGSLLHVQRVVEQH